MGYPKAALFAFCVALVAYNVLSTVKAALRSVHGEKVVDEEVSAYDVAEEVAGTHRGMMIAIPEDEWVVFHGMSPREIGPILKRLAGSRAALGVPQAASRAQEVATPATERGRSEACSDGQAAPGTEDPTGTRIGISAQITIYTGLGREG